MSETEVAPAGKGYFCPLLTRTGNCYDRDNCGFLHEALKKKFKEFKPKNANKLDATIKQQITDFQKSQDLAVITQSEANFAKQDDDDIEFVAESKDCTCCRGYVNICDGDACEYLGICYCVVHREQEA
jgi:hypothetical protein